MFQFYLIDLMTIYFVLIDFNILLLNFEQKYLGIWIGFMVLNTKFSFMLDLELVSSKNENILIANRIANGT